MNLSHLQGESGRYPPALVNGGKIEYPIGDGWRVLSEDMLKDLRRNEIDPRLAKLKEYKFDDEKE